MVEPHLARNMSGWVGCVLALSEMSVIQPTVNKKIVDKYDEADPDDLALSPVMVFSCKLENHCEPPIDLMQWRQITRTL